MTSRNDVIGQNGLAYLADVGDEQQHVSSSQAEIDHIADAGKMVTGPTSPPDGAQYWHGGNDLYPQGWYRLDADGWKFHLRHGSAWTEAEPPPPHEVHRIMPGADHIGDTTEKAGHIADAGKMVGNHSGEATEKPSMADLYPKYFRDVRHLDEMDVYAVHHVFTVNDPSGCLQHASKKILLSGTRNGGKSLAQDIKEARDTLTRKLQLMGVE